MCIVAVDVKLFIFINLMNTFITNTIMSHFSSQSPDFVIYFFPADRECFHFVIKRRRGVGLHICAL